MTDIQSNSVQLMTAFTAVHYFDLKTFFTESSRILVRDGVLAFIGHHLPEVIDPLNTGAMDVRHIMQEINADLIRSEQRWLHVNRYKDIVFPQNYQFVHKDYITVSERTYAQNVVDFYRANHYESLLDSDPSSLVSRRLNDLIAKLKHSLQTNDLFTKDIVLKYEYFIAMGRKLH